MAGSFTAQASLTGSVRVALNSHEAPAPKGSIDYYYDHDLLPAAKAMQEARHRAMGVKSIEYRARVPATRW